MPPLDDRPTFRRWPTIAFLAVVLGVMGGLTSFSVTLYRLFCEATGAFGTTQRVAVNGGAVAAREVTVFFDTSVAPGLKWQFEPSQRSVRVHLGEDSLAFFEAKNLAGRDIVGHAAFNVTPEKVGIYFKKIQCFCFNEEKLAAGQSVQMPVTFFVDPRLATDPDTADVHEITLSYTFFESRRPQEAIDLARFGPDTPDAVAGKAAFARVCSGCHALDHAIAGPSLGGVMGRAAGSVPGYPYSEALKTARVIWTPDTLDRWLRNPQAFLPGAQMPMHVDSETDRREIVAFLASQPRPRS